MARSEATTSSADDRAVVSLAGGCDLDALIIAHRAAKAEGRRLYVTDARGPVARVLDLTGVGALLAPDGDRRGGPHA